MSVQSCISSAVVASGLLLMRDCKGPSLVRASLSYHWLLLYGLRGYSLTCNVTAHLRTYSFIQSTSIGPSGKRQRLFTLSDPF